MPDLRLPDINTVQIAGRLAADPELRDTSAGHVCTMRLAYSREYKGKEGEPRKEELFIDVTCWHKQAHYLGEKLKKGAPLLVEGSLKQDTWESDGQKRSKIEIAARRVQELAWPDKGASDGIPF